MCRPDDFPPYDAPEEATMTDNPTLRYPWRLDDAVARGWDRDAHVAALRSGDEDAISLTHPTNWLTEDEVERPVTDEQAVRNRRHLAAFLGDCGMQSCDLCAPNREPDPWAIAPLGTLRGDEAVPTCDLCGRAQGDSPNVLRDDQPADWNGETGNHLTCEHASGEPGHTGDEYTDGCVTCDPEASDCHECGHAFDGPCCCVNDEAPFYSMDLDADNVADLTLNVASTLSPALAAGLAPVRGDTPLIGIVSAEDGGIIAYALGQEHADLIVKSLTVAS